jgi:hypothetical protein
MNVTVWSSSVALLAVLALSFATAQGDPAKQMQEEMKKAARFTQPGENHKILERFLGKWDTEVQMFQGSKGMPVGKGTAEFSWLMPGRWLQSHGKVPFGPQTMETFYLLGYDNFKMSFVATGVSSFDTAMNRFEGDMTPDGKALIAYGTIDEYLTGENDKMVRYVWRFIDADKFTLEIHDLPIGEVNTKVLEIAYTRAK